MTLREFIMLSPHAINQQELMRQMEKLNKPIYLSGERVPDSLNDISIGQLLMLQYMSTDEDFMLKPASIILGIHEDTLLKEQAEKVIGYSYWVAKEVERINKLFKETSIPPTQEEKQAGVEKLNFGSFGIIDWFAQRMGITDHSEVENVPWVRIYKCMDMDAKKFVYERRLREIYNKKMQKK